jgi:hypothetical protein
MRNPRTSYRNRSISWTREDDDLMEMVFRDLWPLLEPYRKETMGLSMYVRTAVGWFVRFLMFCKANDCIPKEEEFIKWVRSSYQEKSKIEEEFIEVVTEARKEEFVEESMKEKPVGDDVFRQPRDT